MRYTVAAMKQIGEENTDFACYVQLDTEQAVRDLLNAYGVILLSVVPLEGDVQTVASTFCTILHKEQDIVLWFTEQDMALCVRRVMQAGFAMQSVTSTVNPLDINDSHNLINSIYQELVAQQSLQQQQAQAQEEKKQQQFDDQKVQKVQRIIEQTLADIDRLVEKVTGRAPGAQLKQLGEYVEELKKVRMWSNVSRMTEILENVFKLMELIELNTLETMKQEELHIVTDSAISDIDISGEIDKYQRAQQVQAAWTAKSSDDSYYIFFGKAWLYQNFLKKDLFAKLKKVSNTWYGLYATIELMLICAACAFGIYTFVQKVAFGADIDVHLYNALVSLSIVSFLFVITNMIVKRNTFLVIISWVCIFVWYVVVRYLIDINFAL